MSRLEVSKGAAPEAGVFTKKKPDKRLLGDVAFGYTVAVELGDLDVGGTVVVKKKTVMAVEAAEGGGNAIARGCALANGGAVVVKTAKPSQNPRVGVSEIGMDSFKAVVENGGRLLAVEAGKTIVAGLQECIKYADDNGIIFMAFNPAEFYDKSLFR